MSDVDAKLAEIRQRRATITRPPWYPSDTIGNVYGDERPARDAPGTEDTWVADVGGDENREFIAHAPDDITFLLLGLAEHRSMVRYWMQRVEQLRDLLKWLEWRGGSCPSCGAIEDRDTHEPECKLWLAIRTA
ncbi:MAG TPA: hypothetical protein VF678_14700 [bacterium]